MTAVQNDDDLIIIEDSNDEVLDLGDSDLIELDNTDSGELLSFTENETNTEKKIEDLNLMETINLDNDEESIIEKDNIEPDNLLNFNLDLSSSDHKKEKVENIVEENKTENNIDLNLNQNIILEKDNIDLNLTEESILDINNDAEEKIVEEKPSLDLELNAQESIKENIKSYDNNIGELVKNKESNNIVQEKETLNTILD